jgi:hypothetical protein
MFSDPQSITINGVAKSMARIAIDGFKAIYSTADELFKLTLSHTKSKGRIRSMVRVDQRAIVADPLTSVNDYETLGVYLVVDRPDYGYTQAQVDYVIAGLKTWLDTTASGKLFGQEF